MKERCNLIQLYNKISKKDKLVFSAILVLIFSICQLGIKQICGPTFYPDEFGYWASAAKMMGWDWSEVASMGSYYSFGYGLLLYPILCFTSNSITAYQVAIYVNMLLMSVSYILLCVISEKLFGDMPRTIRYLVAGAAVLYPAWIFYMQTTMTEALLFALLIIITYLFISFINRTRILTGVLLVVSLAYFYVVHMRTIGMIIACVLTLILWGISKAQSRKYVFVVVGLVIIAFIGAFYIKGLVQQTVYANASNSLLAANDYAGKVKNIEYIFSLEGFGSLISHLSGKIVYLGVASLGLAYWALACMFRQVIHLIGRVKNKQDITTNEWFAIFVLLSALAQIAISSIFYIHGRNLDLYMNGRYIDFLVPILVMIGFYYLYLSVCVRKKTILFSVVHIMLTVITSITIWKEETQRIRGYFQVGINWMLRDNMVDTKNHLMQIGCVGVIFLLFSTLLIWLVRKKEYFIWLFSMFMFAEIAIAMVTSIQYPYYINNQNYRERVLLDIWEEKCIPDAEIYYLHDGSAQWIDFIQMQLREHSIRVIKEAEWEQRKDEIDILFTANNEKNKEKYSTQFDKCVSESLISLFYNTEDGGNEK